MREFLNVLLMVGVLVVGIMVFKDADLDKAATVRDMLRALCVLAMWVSVVSRVK